MILADPDHLGRNLGRMLAADVTGFAVGPAISAVLVGPFGIAAPFLLIAGLMVAIYPLIARTHVAETDVDAEIHRGSRSICCAFVRTWRHCRWVPRCS